MKEASDTGPVENGGEQEVKYFSGGGTVWFGKLLGAATGFGLSEIKHHERVPLALAELQRRR
jgi:hypothetical protein